MARAVSTQRKTINTAVAWAIGLLIFFPILWTILASFKTESEAIASPPSFLFFDWTLEDYAAVQERYNYFRHFINSVVISVGSTIIGLLVAVPAAWAMAFGLMWMLSTKMLPPVGVLIPIYLLFRDTGLLDSRTGLVIVLTLINLPIIVWMLYTYFREILEAARMDGASLRNEILYVGRAIVREPAAFLFAEPLSNLDAALRVGMRLEISELHTRLATTMIYVTHDQVEAMTMAGKIVVLRAGHIEQVGSPLQLYRKPRNLFVAGFIGSPRMNLLGGPEATRRGAKTIAVRPEHIVTSPTEGPWSGRIGVSEHLGSDTFFHVHMDGVDEPVTVRAGGEVDMHHGDRIYLTPDENVIHLFDERGLRIA